MGGSAGPGDRGAANLRLDPHSPEEISGHPHARDARDAVDADQHDGAGAGGETPLRDPRAMRFERITEPAPKTFGKLENTPGGGAVVHDRVTTMTVERDGNVRFADKPDIDIKLKLPIPRIDLEGMRQDLGKVLTDWYRDPYASTRFGPKSDVARHLTAVPGACDSWGDVMCADPLAPGQEKYVREQKKTNGSILGGPMDITDWLHRKFIGDPYASRKLKLLDDTRDERIARGGEFRGDQLAHSAELMTRTLADLWRATGDPALRREALFELWDDCAEGEGPRGEAGTRARAVVIGWIRAKLSPGSPGAFSDEEIARCRARQTSKQPFTPY